MIAISIVIPVYNVEKYVCQCVDSILNQSFQDFEIILVDDASLDGSYGIIKKKYGQMPRVTILQNAENLGLGRTRNVGMKVARGKYLYFIDSDDVLLPKGLETMYQAAEEHEADVLHLSEWYEPEEEEFPLTGNIKAKLRKDAGFVPRLHRLPLEAVHRIRECYGKQRYSVTVWLNLYRRDFLSEKNIIFPDMIHEDNAFALAVYAATDRIYSLPGAFYLYRQRGTSIVGEHGYARLEKEIRALANGLRYVKKHLIPYVDMHTVRSGQAALFRDLWKNILPFYENDKVVPVGTVEAVARISGKIFGEDAFLVEFLMHYAGSSLRQLQSGISETENTLEKQMKAVISSLQTRGPKAIIFSVPTHGNLGDQAILCAEHSLLARILPDYEIVDIPAIFLFKMFRDKFYSLQPDRWIKPEDILFIHGGGNLGSLYPDEEEAHRFVINHYQANKIIILPQSICFEDNEQGRHERELSSLVYGEHADLHIICRDENSLCSAQKLFPKVNLYLAPDLVTSWQPECEKSPMKRNGVLFVLHNDKEKVRDDNLVGILQQSLNRQGVPFKIIDMVIPNLADMSAYKSKILEIRKKMRQSCVVITDRLHGMIFSIMTGTPVLAMKSLDTKISSGLSWFDDLEWVRDISSAKPSEAESLMKHFLAEGKNYQVPVIYGEKLRDTLCKILSVTVPSCISGRDNCLILTRITQNKKTISYDFQARGNLAQYFSGKAFDITYPEGVEDLPYGVAAIPFVANVLPIIWLADGELVIDELDKDFYECLPKIKSGYEAIYPEASFRGKITVKKVVQSTLQEAGGAAMLYSGGLDATYTLYAHLEEKPALLALWGSDIRRDNIEKWHALHQLLQEGADSFALNLRVIKSSFREFDLEEKLNKLAAAWQGAWWYDAKQGIGILGHAAPYVWKRGIRKLYIASSSAEEKYKCASSPLIDNHVRFAGCKVFHDGFPLSRIEKVRGLLKLNTQYGKILPLNVCWQSTDKGNCCRCEKCYRTIMELIVEQADPAAYGFADFQETLPDMRGFLARGIASNVYHYWKSIQYRMRENREVLSKLPYWKYIDWLLEPERVD